MFFSNHIYVCIFFLLFKFNIYLFCVQSEALNTKFHWTQSFIEAIKNEQTVVIRTPSRNTSLKCVLGTTRAGLLKSCFAFISSSNARPTQLASCANLNCIWRTELFSRFISKNWYGEKRDSRRRFSNIIFQHINGSPARRG